METFLESPKLKARFALAIGLVAVCGLLALAASAKAEIGETVEAAAASAAVTPPAAAEAPAPAPPVTEEPVQTAPVASAPTPDPAPAEALKTPSATGIAGVAPKADPVAPVQESLPALKSTNAPSPLPQTAGAEQEVQKLAQNIGEGSAGSVTPVTEATKALAQGSLDAIDSVAGEVLLHPVELLTESGIGSLPDGSPNVSLTPQSDSFFSRPVIGAFPLQRLVRAGGVEAVAAGSGAPSQPVGRAETRSLVAVGAGAVLAAATNGRAGAGSGSPAPLNLPLPAPGSPGAIASASGGSFFVPLAALLALLALAAPAVLRRLGEGPDFRPATPFVCALERPG